LGRTLELPIDRQNAVISFARAAHGMFRPDGNQSLIAGLVPAIHALAVGKMMPKSAPPRWWSEPSAVSRYAIAVSSVALAIVVAHLLTVFLHTEPIASAMMSAVMLAAWFGGFGPGLLAIALAALAIHYYVTPPVNSFAPKGNLFSLEVAELPRLILFSIAALFIAFLSSAQRAAAQSLRRSRDDLLGALAHQKQIEGELRRGEMYLAEAQRLSQTGSFGWSVSSGEIFWSEESFRIFGYEKASSVTLDMVLQRVHPEDRALVRGTIERASSEGRDFDYEYRLLMPVGSVKHVHVVARAVSDHGGQLEFIGALMDVTAARQAGEELHKTQAELAHVTRVTTLSELTVSIAHEVNQPLAAVVTNAEACLRWLGREAPNLDEARRAVEWIVKDGNRAAEVIRHIRALTSKTDTQKAPLDINDVVNEVIPLVQRELLSQRVSLRAELAPALPVVLADRVQLQQAILNLVMNGIEAMQPVTGWPRQLVIRSDHNEARQVLVAVEDCGVGISAENADRLFNAFFTTRSGGMGMGLAICRSIIEAHGGRISAANNAGPGATFQFTLPVHQESGSICD
jgi:PAS domain S-box-containing protein